MHEGRVAEGGCPLVETFPSLIELLRKRADERPDVPVYTFLEGEEERWRLTCGELDFQARAIGALLQQEGMQGERILLLYPPGLEFIAAFWGCLYAGAVAVPVYPPKPNHPDPRVLAIARDARPRAVMAPAASLDRLQAFAARLPELAGVSWLTTGRLTPDLADDWRHPGSAVGTLAFLQYTSGSTSLPKGVMVSHGNLLHNEEMIRRAFAQSEESVVVGWLPLYHDMGLIGNVLQPLYVGGRCILMSPLAFLQKPLRWLAAIHRYRATTSGGPNFAYELCVRKTTPEQRAGLDLSSWSLAYSGAEPVRGETLDRFSAAFAPYGFRRSAFYPCYGLAEATLFVSGGTAGADPVVRAFDRPALEMGTVEPAAPASGSRSLVGCGQPWMGQEVAIVDPESGVEHPPGRVGEIWVAGPSVAQGYWDRKEATDCAFGARLDGRGPFLRTGDLGFLRDGVLFVAGRLKDLIILRGRNYYPEDLELAAESAHPDLRPGCGAAFSVETEGEESLVIVLELDRRAKGEPGAVLDAVRAVVAEVQEVQAQEVVLVRTGTVPKTSSGKVQRHACRAAYLAGALEVVARSAAAAEDAPEQAAWTRESLLALTLDERRTALVDLLAQEAARAAHVSPSALDAERPLTGLDSLAALELRNAVESALGVALPLAPLLEGASLGLLADGLSQALEQGREGADGEEAALLLRPAAELVSDPLEESGFPLSYGQRALWFLERLAPEGGAYNIAVAAQVVSGLDAEALGRAVAVLAEVHPALRTTFTAPEGEPRQRVHARLDPEIAVEDASGWSAGRLGDRLHEVAFRPFDLAAGPLLRVAVFHRAGAEPVVLFAVHHLIADFWSLGELARQLAGLLHGECPRAPAVSVADFVAWQRARLAGPVGERLWDYWSQKLAGPLQDLALQTDRPRPPVQTHRGGSVELRLGPDLAGAVRRLAGRAGTTLHAALLAVFEALLHRHSGQEDLPIGCPVAGRTRSELARVVGYMVNVVVLRGDFAGEPSFAAHLERVRRDMVGALEHQDFPFPLLAERLQPTRDASRSPLFQAMFSLQGAPFAGAEGMAALALGEPGVRVKLGGLRLDPLPLPRRPAQVDVALEMAELAGGLTAVLRYNVDLFDAATMERMLARLPVLLAAAAAHPETRISLLPLLTPEERTEILAGFNTTAEPLPAGWGPSLHSLVEAQAARTPDAVAVAMAEETASELTYRELEWRANQLAHTLLRLGVLPEEPVGLCTDRSTAMLVGLLGVLKAGAAYLPLDPAYPRERLTYMVEDSGAKILLTEERRAESLPRAGRTVLRLDADWQRVAGESGAPPGVAVGERRLAYMIYTSGSTGRPKGVLVEHGGVVRFLAAMRRAPGLAAGDSLLSVTTLSFDIAALELFLPLAVGGTVVLASRETAVDGRRLAAAITASESRRPAAMQATPATWRLLLESGWRGAPTLSVLCGGEALPRPLAAELLARGAAVWNLYGPTETTIWSAFTRVEPGDGPVPIGRPIANTRVYVLDRAGEPVPVGVAGELLIGGAGVARGYHHRPGLTADRFVPDPWGPPGSRLYRTGDLTRWMPGGTLQFLGRLDHQVKVRGHRLELGEIEAYLVAHPAVREAVVLAREDRPGDLRLVAYVIPAGPPPAGSELRAFLRERLPEPVVPGAYVTLDAWPLTPNGKVDRRALPPPGGAEPAQAALRPGLEHAIAAVWKEVLGVERVGARDNFFDLGGHSLLLARVHARLTESLGVEISMVDLLRHPTVADLAVFLRHERGARLPARIRHRSARKPGQSGDGAESRDIAVIALSGRFPGAADVDTFWRNLREGVESITPFSSEELRAAGVEEELLADPAYVRAGAVLDGIDLFDAGFFGFTPREAETLDPQHRLFLECAWEILERAGYDPGRYPGAVGVYAGVGLGTYLLNNVHANRAFLAAVGSYQAFLGNDKDFVSTRVSYKLGLRGPSVNVQTACSSSLVAVHLARQALLAGECDMVLAGGVSIAVPHRAGYLHQAGGILSPDGHCRTFDAAARGTVRGNGVAIVLLKRLADALAGGDRIRAVIKGSAINNDGAAKVGYTAPGIDGQAEAIAAALEDAGVDAATIGYVEAHGTGTELGDPVEIAALAQAFAAGDHRAREVPCALGSVKSNIGHLDTAAGAAGLIKAVLSLEHGELPPTLHFEQPNPRLDLAAGPFAVNALLCPWRREAGAPRRAGVSSFGIGGTNAHVVLEEAPAPAQAEPSRPLQLLLLSARSAEALDAATLRLAEHLRARPEPRPADFADFADVAYTLSVGRKAFAHRRLLVCATVAEATPALAALDPERLVGGVCPEDAGERPVIFLLPGQGAQHPGMGRDLYAAMPEFRARVDEACGLLRPHLGLDLRETLFPAPGEEAAAAGRLERTAFAQPALFVVEHALARLWMSWGVRPQAMIGHSVGELVAACLAGVFNLEDALALTAERGRLMEAMPGGAMLAVRLPEQEIGPFLGSGLEIAAVNAPAACTVAGPDEAVAELAARLAARGVETQRLHVSHAFHSALMDGAVEPFVRRVAAVPRAAPRLPFLSNLTGTWITAEQATDPAYWGRHLRGTVRFADGIAEILKEPGRILLEAGPGNALSTLARQHPAHGPVVASLRHPREVRSDLAALLEAAGRLWLAGAEIDWDGFWAGERRRRVELPTYPFERRRHWVEPAGEGAAPRERRPAGLPSEPESWLYAPFWKQSMPPALSIPAPGAGPWLVFADDQGVGQRLAERLEHLGWPVVTVHAGEPGGALARSGAGWTLDPACPADYDALLRVLADSGEMPREIVHCWTVTPDGAPMPKDPGALAKMQDLAFHSLIAFAQALGRRGEFGPLRLTVVSNDLHLLPGDRRPRPDKALSLGPCRVIPREYPGVSCRSVDLSLAGGDLAGAVDHLLAELASAPGDEVVAWRGGDRWVQVFEPVRPAAGAPRLRERGVYLITGGLGGIGLTLAERLAERVQARLVLTTRRLAHPLAPPIAARLLALEAKGAEVLVVQADAADPATMAAAVAAARARYGGLHGVVHAAGLPGGGIVQLKTRQDAERVLAPKVQGTLALERALAGEAIDFVLLCSSINGVAGGFGQVDYCAANAFLDAFAQSRRACRTTFWTAVGWDRWRGVGMAADAAARESLHPLLDRCLSATPERTVYSSALSPARHWVLSEHLILGRPTVPGTTWLEMARAAFALSAGAGPVEIRDAVFLTPLVVDTGAGAAEVLTILEKDGEGFTFRVASRPAAGEEGWREHARGRVARPAESANSANPSETAGQGLTAPADILARCTLDLAPAGAAHARGLEGFLTTGPRWRSLRSMHAGERESLAWLALDDRDGLDDLDADLASFGLHPALLDVAAGSVQLRADGNFLPLAYERLVVRAALPRTFYSHARYRDEPRGDTITCDLSLLDAAGKELVAVTGFSMRRIGDEALAQLRALSGAAAAPAAAAGAVQGLIAGRYESDGGAGGIAPAQGADLFERILAGALPQVVVSTRDLGAALAEIRSFDTARLAEELGRTAGAAPMPARAQGLGPAAVPGDEIEARIARVWQRVLGIEQIGIHDNFFELGGTSLAGIQLVAELKRELGVEIPAVSIFEAPTVSALARRLRPREEGTAAFDHSRDRAHRQREGLEKRQMEALAARRRRAS